MSAAAVRVPSCNAVSIAAGGRRYADRECCVSLPDLISSLLRKASAFVAASMLVVVAAVPCRCRSLSERCDKRRQRAFVGSEQQPSDGDATWRGEVGGSEVPNILLAPAFSAER